LTEYGHLLDAATNAALAGGDVVRGFFGGARNVREKAPGDWVSEADISSEAAIKRSLEEAAPDIPFFGEEGGGEHAALGWYVDPLDGTANFLHGFRAVGVSVALVADDRPVVGVVHSPLLDHTWRAVTGQGAERDGVAIRVSDRAPAQAICATGFPFRLKHQVWDHYVPAFLAAFETFEDLRRVGGASLDLCWTADGTFDGFFELRLGTWDVAAGALVVREAGGVVSDWEGDDTQWLRSGDILAGNPAVHAALLEKIAGAREPGAPAR
jgi:myo-inositol-1(or 4)-monophosphatase